MIRPFGEGALLVELASTERVQALAAAVAEERLHGVIECVPGMETLLVELDPPQADVDVVAAELERLVAGLPDRPVVATGRHRSIPVVYGAEFGPDLDDVASLTGLSPTEVVEAHAGSSLSVAICGFAPGFAYLVGLPDALAVPRLATPRTSTPAGSVAIAGRQSGIYPAALPGGWRVIGRTPIALFDPHRHPPAYLAPGDTVAFRPVDPGEWERLAGDPEDW